MKSVILLPALFLVLSACGREQDQEQAPSKVSATPGTDKATSIRIDRQIDFAAVKRGGELFRQYCAGCHGLNAQGAPNWQQRRPDGSFPAPPLDGTGHAWHHPKKVLQMTIREGTRKLGGSMPAWGNTLSNEDIDAIIAWFQAKWPDAIYAEWQQRDKRQ